jgi:MFS family permease
MITVALLVAAVCVRASGWPGDLVGKRRMRLIRCVPLVLGSVVCVLASSVVAMISGRGLQGLGVRRTAR